MSLFFNSRFQDQVGDASVGPKNLMPLLGMLDDVPSVTIELALLGDGSDSTRCLLRMDISVVGVPSAPTRPQLVSIAALAKQMVAGSEAARLLPPTCYGVPTLDLLAAVFLYTLENPYRLYSCITVPLNVSGKRTLQSLQQQLPYLKLFTLGLRCLPPGSIYHFKGALYRGVDISRSAAFRAKYDSHATAYQAGTVIVFAAPTSFSMSDQAAGEFTKGIQFVWPDGCGVKMHDLSAFDDEGEVVVEGPSMFEVTAATMTPTGTLVVVLKKIDNFINYLTPDDLASSTHAISGGGGAGAAASSSAHAIAFAQPAFAQPASVQPQAASSAISSLTVKHVSLLVKSVKPTPTFTKYAAAVVEHDVSGVFILKATDDELSALFDQMHVALPHKVELREAVRSWRANPEQALQAIDRELRAEEAAAAQAAADKKAREEAAAAHKKAEQLRKAEEQRQMEQRRKAEAAEAERKAEEARKAAAATPARSIVHNGHVYKSLADHDPHSTTAISEYNKLYNLDPPWELCPNTPDALHVCKTYPWAAYALVFADGSAHWTALAPSANASLKPGTQAASSGCLRQQGGQYGIRGGASSPCVRGAFYYDLLIRRKL